MEEQDRTRAPVVLIADDDITVRLLARESLEQAGFRVKEAPNGALAVSMFEEERPSMVLLDVRMPEMNGFEVCTAIRKLPGGRNIPILMITGSDDVESINSAYESGATDFAAKPINWTLLGHRAHYMLRGHRILKALQCSEGRNRALLNAIPDLIIQIRRDGCIVEVESPEHFSDLVNMTELKTKHLERLLPRDLASKLIQLVAKAIETESMQRLNYPYPLNGQNRHYESRIVLSHADEAIVIIQDVTEQKENVARLRRAMRGTMQVISSTIEKRDPYTGGHQRRVADFARAIATEMGLPNDKISALRVAGRIHDLGKISVPAEILSKPTQLTKIEHELVKEHVQTGYEILRPIDFPWPIADIVYQHHERIDGSGYPQGLRGEDMLLEAKILAVADVVEAMASHRPYRAALGMPTALDEIARNKGKLYDTTVAEASIRTVQEGGYDFDKYERRRAEGQEKYEDFFDDETSEPIQSTRKLSA